MSANSDARFGIINQQQHLAFNHHPRHLGPPPPHHYHHQQPLPLTAAIDCLQPRHTTNNGTTNGNMAMPRHELQQPPAQPETTKNTQKWTQTTPPVTNDGQHPRTDTSDNKPRWDSSPPPPLLHSNMKPRCHVATSNVATKQRTTNLGRCSLFVVVVRAPRWVLPSIHPNPPCSHTAWWQTNDVGQGRCG